MDHETLRRVMEEMIPFNRTLGLRVSELSKGFVRMEVPFRDDLIGDFARRAIHGGVISALADTAGGCAVWSTIDDHERRVSTIDLRIDYLRPGRPEGLVAEANVVRVGNRVGVVDVRVFHASDPSATVATGKGVYNITSPKTKSASPSSG
jgi:uncharacterized protein (TIGR00369 family)